MAGGARTAQRPVFTRNRPVQGDRIERPRRRCVVGAGLKRNRQAPDRFAQSADGRDGIDRTGDSHDVEGARRVAHAATADGAAQTTSHAGEVRAAFTKSGGNLAETGAVSFMFDRVGVVEYDAAVASGEGMFEAALEAGADDVVSNDGGHEVYAAQDKYASVAKALEAKFGEPRKATLVWRPQNTVAVGDEQGEKLLKLIENLNEHDDVQNVYANFEVSHALVQRMSA